MIALAGTRPDRVPIDFMGTGCGLGVEAYRRLMARGAAGEPPEGTHARDNSEPQGVFVSGPPCPTVYDPSLLNRFDVDFRRVGLPELGGAETASAIPRITAGLADEAAAVAELTGRAVVARAPCPGPFGWCVENLGLETFLTALRRRQDEAAAMVGEATEAILGAYRLLLAGAGPYVDLVEVADDYAYAGGPFLAPADFAAVFQPALALIIETIRGLAPRAAVLFHSCGSVLDLLPGLLEAGIDVLSPLDPTGKGMTPEILRDTARRARTAAGRRLVLHGGFDPAVLAGSEADIRREVRRLVATLGADGGYILAPAGDILEDVPPEKLELLFRVAREVRPGAGQA